MATYKLKSLLYLLVFIFCAWLYNQVDSEVSGPDNQPFAAMSASQDQPVSAAANGL